jgi:uncharacterized protein (TIGR03437 family)
MKTVTAISVFSWTCAFGQSTLTTVSAANYSKIVAPGSIVSIFGTNLASGVFTAPNQGSVPLPTSLGGVSGSVTDASGTTLPLSLIAVTPGQINAVLPSGLQAGQYGAEVPGVLNLTTATGAKMTGNLPLAIVAPSMFTADQTGGWLAAAQVVIAHADGSQTFLASVATCGSNLVYNGMTFSYCVPIPINLGSVTDQAVLELYGTGIRGSSSIVALCPNCGYTAVSVSVGSGPIDNYLPVLYAGPQGAGGPDSFPGVDQVNIALPHALTGVGTVALTVQVLAGYMTGPGGVVLAGEAADANTVYVNIK